MSLYGLCLDRGLFPRHAKNHTQGLGCVSYYKSPGGEKMEPGCALVADSLSSLCSRLVVPAPLTIGVAAKKAAMPIGAWNRAGDCVWGGVGNKRAWLVGRAHELIKYKYDDSSDLASRTCAEASLPRAFLGGILWPARALSLVQKKINCI